MTSDSEPDVLVIGAGIAGLTAAAELRDQGLRPKVLEKSRGFGGRAATRRLHGVRVDHGAQFFTVRDARFRRRVDGWLEAGDVVAWAHGIPSWTADEGWRPARPDAHARYVCPEGMNTLGKLLADGTDVEREARATTVRRDADGWHVELEDGRRRSAQRLILTPPVPQSLALLENVALPAAARSALGKVRYGPCFAVMAGYPEVATPDWPAVLPIDHPDLAWIAQDGSKRGEGSPTVLVLHSTPAFARRAMDDRRDDVAEALLRSAEAIVPWAVRPAWQVVQRWRYAMVEKSHAAPVLGLAEGLFACGDAFASSDGAGRIETAFLSGRAAAAAAADASRLDH